MTEKESAMVYRVWFEVYCAETPSEDPHAEFAGKLKLSRPEAKELAHRIAYSGSQGLKLLKTIDPQRLNCVDKFVNESRPLYRGDYFETH